MYHSVTFGDKNTWTDWKLVPTSRPVVAPPEPKIKTVDIPGGDGVIDLTESLTGYPVFGRRTGSFEFIVLNDYHQPVDTVEEWHVTYSKIMNYLHGRQMEMSLEDDPNYWYEGRFKVDSWNSDKNYSTITISYDVEPYKWLAYDSSIHSKSFTATTGYQSYEFLQNVNHLGDAPVTPTFVVSTSSTNGVRIQFINNTIGINTEQLIRNGTHQVPRMIFYGPRATIRYRSESGTVPFTVRWEEGSL